MKNKNLITVLNLGSTIILQGLAFLSGPIFSKILGPNNYGIASVYLTWVTIASTVFSLQAGGCVALARIHFPMEEQQRFQSSTLSLATLSYICFSVCVLLISSVLSRWLSINVAMIAVGLLHGWGMYCVHFMNLKFTYEFKAGRNFLLSICTSLCAICLSLALIYAYPLATNYWGRILGQAATYALIGIGLLTYILHNGKCVYDKTYWLFALPITIPTAFHALSNIVLNQSDKVMLQWLENSSDAGIYALSSTFSHVLNTVWNALNNSWVPFYYEYTRTNQLEEMKKHAKNYMELFTILCMGFILLSREVFHVYASNSFWDGTDLIPLLSVGCYFVFLYSFPVNYEFYNKKTKMIAAGTILAAIGNIILNCIFIRIWGMLGAVIATVAAYGLQFMFHYFQAKKILPGSFPFRLSDFIPGFLAVCLTCILYFFTRDYWLVRWGIGAVMGAYIIVKICRRREIF